MSKSFFVAASILFLTLIGYFQFPGHTYLYSDTQIYAPILEHYWNPAVLARDPLALHPHVSFSIYDEMTLALRQVAGLSLFGALTLQQLLFRAMGILGVFLIATSLKLSTRMALLVAAIFALGATIPGPSVLGIEYEPVPRGFAVPLLLLAIGFVAHGYDLAAGIAGSVAFLYHPPTVVPFWAIYFCLTLWPTKPVVIMSRRIIGLLPLLFAAIAMLFLSRIQSGVTEPQQFFGSIGPLLEKLQRMRATYNWVSMWPDYLVWHYAFLWGVCLAGYFRLRKAANQDLKFFLIGMPLLGVLSIPITYVLLEEMKWVLIPQIQPMRAILFVTVFAGILAAVAGIRAAQAGRYLESFLWLAITFAIPANTRPLQILLPDLGDPLIRLRLLIVIALAGGVTLVAWAQANRKIWATGLWGLLIVVPFFLIPGYGKVTNYPNLMSPELKQLSQWARSSTSKEDVFLFPDAEHQLYPGIFRKLGEQWWERWQATMAGKFDPGNIDRYAALGIDYIVVHPDNRVPGREPAFENSEFVVYRVSRTGSHQLRSLNGLTFRPVQALAEESEGTDGVDLVYSLEELNVGPIGNSQERIEPSHLRILVCYPFIHTNAVPVPPFHHEWTRRHQISHVAVVERVP
jgi:hypothetical protein